MRYFLTANVTESRLKSDILDDAFNNSKGNTNYDVINAKRSYFISD